MTTLPNASQQAAADAVVDRVDLGSTTAGGRLRLYSGLPPADADSAPNGTLLAEFDLQAPAFGSASSAGVATANGAPFATTGEAGAGSGTAAQSARVVNRDGATVFDEAVRGANDPDLGEGVVLTNTSIAADQAVALASITYQQPAG